MNNEQTDGLANLGKEMKRSIQRGTRFVSRSSKRILIIMRMR